MDFTKFVSLIDTKALFFSRADKLGDTFEGSYSKANLQLRPHVYKNVPEHALKKISIALEQLRRYVAINCWHINDYESAAMWSLYVQGDEGIAIQTTFKSLTESFCVHTADPIYVGKVQYIDYDTDWMPEGNLFYPFIHKRRSFEHENELRAILTRFLINKDGFDLSSESIQNGVLVSVDLEILIHNIYVSPTSPEWFYNLVKSILNKYGLSKNVKQSSLADDSPVF